MKEHVLAALATLLASAGLAIAQNMPANTTPPADCTPQSLNPEAVTKPECSASWGDGGPSNGRVWINAEYLLWWIKNGPAPVPLVTTNPNSFAYIGALNEPGTRVLFGGNNSDLDYHAFSGGRLTAGGWLDSESTLGAEVSGFLFESRPVNFAASSPGGFAPAVSVPFFATVPFNLNPAGETALNSGNTPNVVTVTSSSQLWGAEANGLIKLLDNESFHVVMLTGFRYLQLNENLSLNDTISDAATGGNFSVTDSFQTRNEFFGGQLGLKAGATFGRLCVDATMKCALGVDRQSLDINGNTVVTNGAFGFPTGTTPGGIFAQPSNIGHSSANPFTVVPEAQFTLGYNLTDRVRCTVGYDFLYVSDVLRPGQQINRNINPTQDVLLGGTGGVLVGPASPLPATSRSDFWAQGLTCGLEFRY